MYRRAAAAAMVQGASEQALLNRIAQRVGPDASQPRPDAPEPQAEMSPEEQEELARTRLLASIARNDDMTEQERAQHDRFLKAKEEAMKRGNKPSGGAEAAIISSGRREQVRMAGEVYDSEVGKRLDALGATAQSDDARHDEFVKAKEAADLAKERQKDWQASLSQPEPGGKAAQNLVPTWVTEEQYREYGYPKLDPKFKDKEWHRKQMELDMTDPRHNPNLLLDQNDPEFWHNAARKPFAKALLRSEQHWDSRRKTWLKQYESISDLNNKRGEIAELLEDCSPDIKRLVTPVMKYTITWIHLNNMLNRSIQLRKTFAECLEEKDNRETLEGLRHRIDAGGEQEAELMLEEYDARWKFFVEKLTKEKLEEEKDSRALADVTTLSHIMNWGNKCKKDGTLEWEKGNWAEAHASWRQADEALRKFRAGDETENRMLLDLHIAVLKNFAQACIKLEYWTDAIEAADAAVKIDPDDHKAWFRKAVALEGIGKIDEAEKALERVDECAVGRADRVRITKDTQARREKLQAIREKEAAAKTKMFGKALEKGIFGEDRAEAAVETIAPKEEPKKPKQLEAWQEATRKHLTKEAAEDLLMELTESYKDSTFQAQIRKLAIDVRHDKREFLGNLKKVALPMQKPVLERFGFEPSERGVAEMTRAIQDFTRGKRADAGVKARADETTQALYGCMYDMLTRPDGDQTAPPPAPLPIDKIKAKVNAGKSPLDSDSD